MSTPGHKPAVNPLPLYAFQGRNEESRSKELHYQWSDEEDLESDDYESEDDFDEDEDFDDDDEDEYSDEQLTDDYDSDSEEDDHEYLEDVKSHHYTNNYAAGPGYFYPEQPYVGLPIVPKPSPEASMSKLHYYILSPICDIAMIYLKFAVLAILIYACALWYTVHYGDMISITDLDIEEDPDTCPANLST